MRPAGIADLPKLLALETVTFPPYARFSPEEYRYFLTRAHSVHVAVDEGEDIVAFGGAFIHARHKLGHVFSLNVHPRRRREGLARAIIRELERRMRRTGMRRAALEVNVANRPAIRLYESEGYVRMGRIPDYYPHYPEVDAWSYAKALD